MPIMAKKKPKPEPPAQAPKRIREGYNINIWIDPRLGAVLDTVLDGKIIPRTSKTALIEMLLHRFFEEKYPEELRKQSEAQ